MITRYNFKWIAPKLVESPVKEEYELITLINNLKQLISLRKRYINQL